MKQFKKALLSFVLIVCAVFLCACGSTPPPVAQIDTPASVNTSGTYTTATKEDLTPYITSTDPAYVGSNTAGYKMSSKMVVNNTPVMTANYIFKVTEGTVTEMVRKMSMNMSGGGMTITMNTMEYLKNNTYYSQQGDQKFFLNNENLNWDDVIGSELEFDFEAVVEENIGGMLLLPGLTVTKAVEGTTTKIKAVATNPVVDVYDEDEDDDTEEILYTETETFVLVVKDGKFAGLHFEVTDDVSTDKTEINMVPFTDTIDFPSSFSGYVPYDPAVHDSPFGA